jgi:hypothetical protein
MATMEGEIKLWKKILKEALIDIAVKFQNNETTILNEVLIGDEIRQRILFHTDLVNSNMQVWPEATWFKKNKLSGFQVDRTIMSDHYAIYSQEDTVNSMKVKEFNKGFFYDGPAIAIELKFQREGNIKYEEMLKDYVKLHSIQESFEHRFKEGFYKHLNSLIWRGVLVVGCSTEIIYAECVQRLHLKMQQTPPKKEHIVFVFGPSKYEFLIPS